MTIKSGTCPKKLWLWPNFSLRLNHNSIRIVMLVTTNLNTRKANNSHYANKASISN